MSNDRTDIRDDDTTLRDDILAFDNYLEMVSDTCTSVDELTTDIECARPTSVDSATTERGTDASVAVNVDKGDGGRCKAILHGAYRLLSSHVGLIVLLIAYTLLGAAVLHHTEYWREQQMHAELDAVRQRVVADIVNITTASSRDARPNSSRTLMDSVELLVVKYGDARESLRPSSKSPGWTFTGALYFCGTVYTTVGYGNVSPVTATGRIITILYAIVGIPLCLIVLASVGKLLTTAIKYVWKFVRRFYYTGSCRRVRRLIPVSRLRMSFFQLIGYQLRRRTVRFRRAVRRRNVSAPDEEQCVEYEVDDNFNLPPAVALIIGISYMLLGALTYTAWEDWSYLEAFYFTFISLCTIGFGDVVPEHPRFFMAFSIYLLFGLALIAMIVNVFMVSLHVTITKVGQRLVEAVPSDVLEMISPETQQRQYQEQQQQRPSVLSSQLTRRRSI